MQTLYVLYDEGCALCCRIRLWLEHQPRYVRLTFIAADSPEAHRRFPMLDHARTLQELTVISDNGAIYRNTKAWVICLWALREYRAWSLRLSSPELMPLARRLVVWVSRNRSGLGKFSGVRGGWR